MSGSAISVLPAKRAIPSWRFMAGVFVHFAVPAWLVTTPILCLLAAPAGGTWQGVVAQLPRASAWFLGGYAALAAVSIVAATIIDPVSRWRRVRREGRDPQMAALASSQRVTRAISDGRRLLDAPSVALLDSLRRRGWDHEDERCQALSNDLAEVVRTSGAAIASARPERRPELRAMAAESLAHLDVALRELAEERARLDEGDAKVIARYVRLRHTQSDSAGEPS